MNKDLLKSLRSGQLITACALAFPSPDSGLERFAATERDLANFLDALVFGHFNDALIATQLFRQRMRRDSEIQQIMSTEEAHLQVLRRFDDQLPAYLASGACRQVHSGLLPHLLAERREENVPLTNEALASIEPVSWREDLIHRLRYAQAVTRFKQKKALWFQQASCGQLFYSRPYVPLRFKDSTEILKQVTVDLSRSKRPAVLFMDSMEGDWASLLSAGETRPLLFVFPTTDTLFHCLQFPELETAFFSPLNGVLALDLYPNEQLRTQSILSEWTEPFDFHWICQRRLWHGQRSAFEEDLRRCLSLGKEQWLQDSEAGDRLYRLGQNVKDSWRTERLGKPRFFALHSQCMNRKWSDPHKGHADDTRGISPLLAKRYGQLMRAVPCKNQRRDLKTGAKLHIAHVVPQLVRVGHAPTKLVQGLLRHHNRKNFELSLLSTERLVFRASEYPFDSYSSEPSPARAGEVLKAIQDSGVHVYVENAKLGYRQTAERLARNLSQLEVDFVFFHGPDVINSLATRLCDVPYRVLFEHGSLPEEAGFDLIIASSEESVQRYQKHFASLDTEIVALPFCYDATTDWESEAYSRSLLEKRWGIPLEAKLLTTISNNLESRVAGEMCASISQILSSCPQACYAPMGEINDPKSFRARFSPSVRDRIFVLGPQERPSQLARSMHVYLNEFPFGSGLSLLDAMAAGCPVVSMHYPEGPPQGRYGAVFMGLDYVVQSCRAEDYANLTIRLLTEESLYKRWSRHAQTRYLQQADPGIYVKKLEALVLDKALSFQYTSAT